jgi:hypothetical protein
MVVGIALCGVHGALCGVHGAGGSPTGWDWHYAAYMGQGWCWDWQYAVDGVLRWTSLGASPVATLRGRYGS